MPQGTESPSVLFLDNLESIWNEIVGSVIVEQSLPIEEKLKKEHGDLYYIYESLEYFRAQMQGLMIRVPDEDCDLAILPNVVWVRGYTDDRRINTIWSKMFPLHVAWAVNQKVLKLPVLIVSQQGMNIVNEGCPHLSKKRFSRITSERTYRHEYWDSSVWRSVGDIVDCSLMSRFMEGKMVPPSYEFFQIPGTNYLCVPVIPSMIPTDDLHVQGWGLFAETRVVRESSVEQYV